MKIFVFGAGASANAHTTSLGTEQKPPLTKDIFFNAYTLSYAHQVGLSRNDIEIYKGEIEKFSTLEEWLTKKWENAISEKEGRHKEASLRKLAKIAFYIWITLLRVSEVMYQNISYCRDDNNYRTFFTKLYDKEPEANFAIVNFNYDLLVDFAYKDVFGRTFHNINDYLDCNYIKPHGSVNWFLGRRTTDRVLNLERKFEFDTLVRIVTAVENMYKSDPIEFASHRILEPDDRNLYKIDNILREFDDQYFYPLIFLPLIIKNYDFVSGFSSEIIRKAKQIFRQATDIYLVGYGAKDEIILDLLKEVNTPDVKLHIANTQNSSESIMKSLLKKFTLLKRGSINDRGFANFVSEYT